MESVGKEVTADLVKAGLSYRAISERLRELYPHIRRGLSFRRVREYCIANGLRTATRRAIVTDNELDESVARALAKVGQPYGQRRTHRVIRDAGLRVGLKRVGKSLKRVKAKPQERQHQNTNDKNMTAEQIWPEVDDRDRNLAKPAVIDMESQGRIHYTDPVSKYCTSYVIVNVSEVGLQRFIDAWNNHSISGSGHCDGIPNERAARDTRINAIAEYKVPAREDATSLCERHGAWYCDVRDAGVGLDPLADRSDLI